MYKLFRTTVSTIIILLSMLVVSSCGTSGYTSTKHSFFDSIRQAFKGNAHNYSNDTEPQASYKYYGGPGFWQHFRRDLHFNYNDRENSYIKSQVKWLAAHPKYLNRVFTRAAPYMYFMLDTAEKRNIPSELILLPTIESSYNPFAMSSTGAAGMWQLTKGTARGFGVIQNNWYDGRRDIYASTNAALDYLTYLQSYFSGDWMLAVAAYTYGEGSIQAAVIKNAHRNKSTELWDLHIPQSVKFYVARLIAISIIIKNPSYYKVNLPNISDKPYIIQVELDGPIDLISAAKLAKMSPGEIKALNPGYRHSVTSPAGPYSLLLPFDKVSVFKDNLKNAETENIQNDYDTAVKLAEKKITNARTVKHKSKSIHITNTKLVANKNTKNTHTANKKITDKDSKSKAKTKIKNLFKKNILNEISTSNKITNNPEKNKTKKHNTNLKNNAAAANINAHKKIQRNKIKKSVKGVGLHAHN